MRIQVEQGNVWFDSEPLMSFHWSENKFSGLKVESQKNHPPCKLFKEPIPTHSHSCLYKAIISQCHPVAPTCEMVLLMLLTSAAHNSDC